MKYGSMFILLLLAGTGISHAQEKPFTDSVLVLSPQEVVLKDAKKMELEPVIDVPQTPAPVFKYSLKAKQLLFDPAIGLSKPINIGSPGQAKILPFYLKIGYGNYASPLFEFYAHSLRTKTYAAGVSIKHISASGKPDYSNWSENSALAHAKRFMKRGTLWTDAGYLRNVVHFYGYDHELYKPSFSKDTTKQRYQTIDAAAGFSHLPKDSSGLSISPSFRFYTLNTNRNVSEQGYNLLLSSAKLIAGNMLKVSLMADHSSYNPDTLLSRTFVSLVPSYRLSDKKWTLDLGVNLTYYHDTAVNKMYPFPRVEFNYLLDENHTVSAGMTGDYRKNSYRSLSEENPFINDRIQLKNTINQFELHAAMRGKLSNKLSYFAGYKFSLVEKLHFFVTDTNAFRRFNVIYEEDIAKVMNIHLEMNYQLAEKIKLSATGNLYKYVLPTLDRPWQRPSADLKISASYNLGNKIYANTDIFIIGGRYAKKIPPGEAKLNTIADFNLGLNYHYSKVIGVFLNANNLSAVRYQRWYNYPAYGINLTGGLTFSF